ncbi:hypothetical protein PVK06_017852 [Gossypium arboreum]|uniref:Uncharacterized protein n=1 Tax=Gossypium arboreum TaxID=29729 RepID=A0ABR0Q4B0_GOSAR|nr:hypothetical protein PVK06_017852 [Gossypium arboreum]
MRTIRSATEFFVSARKLKKLPVLDCIPIFWKPPVMRAFKLNTDGSFIGNPDLLGAGTVILDHMGSWS